MRIDFGKISVYLAPIVKAGNESKREAERLCIRNLIIEAFGESKTLTHDSCGRPGIEGMSVSVSHSSRWGAIALAPAHIHVGIDIEEDTGRAARVIKRVLRGPFTDCFLAEDKPLQAWTLLEAAFKCAYPNEGLALVDFLLPSPVGGIVGKQVKIAGQPCRNLDIIASQYPGEGLPFLSLVAETQSFVP